MIHRFACGSPWAHGKRNAIEGSLHVERGFHLPPRHPQDPQTDDCLSAIIRVVRHEHTLETSLRPQIRMPSWRPSMLTFRVFSFNECGTSECFAYDGFIASHGVGQAALSKEDTIEPAHVAHRLRPSDTIQVQTGPACRAEQHANTTPALALFPVQCRRCTRCCGARVGPANTSAKR